MSTNAKTGVIYGWRSSVASKCGSKRRPRASQATRMSSRVLGPSTAHQHVEQRLVLSPKIVFVALVAFEEVEGFSPFFDRRLDAERLVYQPDAQLGVFRIVAAIVQQIGLPVVETYAPCYTLAFDFEEVELELVAGR